MELTDKPLSNQESLDLIQQMIRSTQGNFSHDSFYYLFWGWLVFGTALAQYTLMQLNINWAPAVWALMPLGAVVSILYSRKQSQKITVRTHLDRVLGYLWLGLGVSFFLVLALSRGNWQWVYPIIMVLYAIGLFASGGAMQFRPLIMGAVACWVLAVVAYFLPFELQLLCLAGAVLLGYIIPGHLLKAKFAHETV